MILRSLLRWILPAALPLGILLTLSLCCILWYLLAGLGHLLCGGSC